MSGYGYGDDDQYADYYSSHANFGLKGSKKSIKPQTLPGSYVPQKPPPPPPPRNFGFGNNPAGFGANTGFGFGSVNQYTDFEYTPSYSTTTVVGFGQQQSSFSDAPAAFTKETGFGSGFAALELPMKYQLSQWQKYDGRKRPLPNFEDFSSYVGERGAKKPRKPNAPTLSEVEFGRDRCYGIKKASENMPPNDHNVEKDDSLIKVDKVLTNPKYNVWNLPSKAKVLLASNIPASVANPRFLFNFFSSFGDVYKVKILQTKSNTALVEFATATDAMRARDHSDGFCWCGQKIFVSFAKIDEIKIPKQGIQSHIYQDFNIPEYRMMHRFSSDDLKRQFLPHITAPICYLYINNIPRGKTPSEISTLFMQSGLRVVSIVGMRTIPKRKKLIENAATGAPIKLRCSVFVHMASESDAALAMAFFNGKYSSEEQPDGLKISFTSNVVDEARLSVSNNHTLVRNYEQF